MLSGPQFVHAMARLQEDVGDSRLTVTFSSEKLQVP